MDEIAKPTRGAQWANSYEAQLSDADLHWLHSALLARTPSDKAIREKLPPWKAGPRAGQKVALSTLSYIRERLMMEESFRVNETTTESLLEQLKTEVPGISEAQLEEVGSKLFTTLAIRQQDAATFVRIRAARTHAELEKAKLALRERELNRQDESLALEKEKFKRETCEMVIKYAEDARAKEIVNSSATHSDKLNRLGQLMFPDDWKPLATEAVP
jgi:hypothetical protein